MMYMIFITDHEWI